MGVIVRRAEIVESLGETGASLKCAERDEVVKEVVSVARIDLISSMLDRGERNVLNSHFLPEVEALVPPPAGHLL